MNIKIILGVFALISEQTPEAVPPLIEVDMNAFEEVIYEPLGNIFVKNNGKWGVVNRENQQLVQCKYDYIAYAWDENSDNYIVVQNDKFGKITETGKEIFPCLYDGITTWVEYGPNGHYVRIGDRMGLVDYNGKIVIPIQYDRVACLDRTSWAIIYDKGKVGLYDVKNKTFFLPLEYDFLDVNYNWMGLEKNKPTRIITYKDGIVNILDNAGRIIQARVPKTELKGKFAIDIDAYQYSPCSDELLLMLQNQTFQPPNCLLEALGNSIESIYYNMQKN